MRRKKKEWEEEKKNNTKLREKKKGLEFLTMMTATQPEEREGETCDQCAKRNVMKSGMGREQTNLFEGSKEESEEVEVLTMMTATQPEVEVETCDQCAHSSTFYHTTTSMPPHYSLLMAIATRMHIE